LVQTLHGEKFSAVLQSKHVTRNNFQLSMAANTLPSGIADLFLLGGRMHAGLETHGPWLKLVFATDFGGYLHEARETENAYAVARARQAAAGQRFATADERLTAWLAKARLVVMLALGGSWSERWLGAGFTHRQTNVPKRLAARIELGRRLVTFLADHPEYAVPFAGVTAEEAFAVYEEIKNAEREVRAARIEAAQCKLLRDAAEKRLRRKMRCVVLLLTAQLGKGDARWLAFGLNRPKRGARARVICPGVDAEIIPLPETAPARLTEVA
jgi:hypothetical protein